MLASANKRSTPRTARYEPRTGSIRAPRRHRWCENPFSHPSPRESLPAARRRAFTLLEWLISIAIIGILASLSTLLFRKAAEGSVMAQARNAVITYAQVTRSYAIANHIETMLVVNPFNGRFEIWYLNPPPLGGPWSPQPSAVPPAPDFGNVDSYAFAPILDPAARLPHLTGTDQPAAVVTPIDFDPQTRPTPTVADSPEMDNLTWAAFCFDETGQLVIRTRRIATRTFYMRDRKTVRSPEERNRLSDETPDLTLSPLVNATGAPATTDTPITSTRGFIISDLMKMKHAIGDNPTNPAALVGWLTDTLEGRPYQAFAQIIVLNRFTGQQLLKGAH